MAEEDLRYTRYNRSETSKTTPRVAFVERLKRYNSENKACTINKLFSTDVSHLLVQKPSEVGSKEQAR